jgi:hypothetical protein
MTAARRSCRAAFRRSASGRVIAAILALLSFCGAAPVLAAQAPQPQATPDGTVGELYADKTFFEIRNAFPPAMVQRFSRCFTPELVRHLEAHNADVERWLAAHKDEDLKLPMSEGPIFLSNYEGADSFSVGRAEVDGDKARVPVTFSYTYEGDTLRWVDVAMLRLVDGLWLLDDIQFDPELWDDYTLRKRMALDD